MTFSPPFFLRIFSRNPSQAAQSFQPMVFTDDESFSESFTAVADLRDGTYILLQLLFSNAGFGDYKEPVVSWLCPKDQRDTIQVCMLVPRNGRLMQKVYPLTPCARTEGANVLCCKGGKHICIEPSMQK